MTEILIGDTSYVEVKGDSCQGCAFFYNKDNCLMASDLHLCDYRGIIWRKKGGSKTPVEAISEGNQGLGSQEVKETPVEASGGFPEPPGESSMVNKPKHYQIFPEYEVRDICKVMADRMQEEGYSAFFISDYVQFLQYCLRFDQKNGLEDLEKADYYLDKMITKYRKAINSATIELDENGCFVYLP